MSEQFTVRGVLRQWRAQKCTPVVSAQEAGRAFQHYTTSICAQLGSTARVIVIDRHDCIVREWKFEQGITYPPPGLPPPYDVPS